jgi:hypothetical protein
VTGCLVPHIGTPPICHPYVVDNQLYKPASLESKVQHCMPELPSGSQTGVFRHHTGVFRRHTLAAPTALVSINRNVATLLLLAVAATATPYVARLEPRQYPLECRLEGGTHQEGCNLVGNADAHTMPRRGELERWNRSALATSCTHDNCPVPLQANYGCALSCGRQCIWIGDMDLGQRPLQDQRWHQGHNTKLAGSARARAPLYGPDCRHPAGHADGACCTYNANPGMSAERAHLRLASAPSNDHGREIWHIRLTQHKTTPCIAEDTSNTMHTDSRDRGDHCSTQTLECDAARNAWMLQLDHQPGRRSYGMLMQDSGGAVSAQQRVEELHAGTAHNGPTHRPWNSSYLTPEGYKVTDSHDNNTFINRLAAHLHGERCDTHMPAICSINERYRTPLCYSAFTQALRHQHATRQTDPGASRESQNLHNVTQW